MSYISTSSPGLVPIQQVSIDLARAAGVYDVLSSPTTSSLIEVYAIYNAQAGAGLVSVALQTDDTTPDVLLSAAEGAVANLTGSRNLAFARTKPLAIVESKKLQATIVGTGSAGMLVMIYRPIFGSVTQS